MEILIFPHFYDCHCELLYLNRFCRKGLNLENSFQNKKSNTDILSNGESNRHIYGQQQKEKA